MVCWGFHRGVVWTPRGTPEYKHAEEGTEPDEGGEEREEGCVAPHVGGKIVAW